MMHRVVEEPRIDQMSFIWRQRCRKFLPLLFSCMMAYALEKDCPFLYTFVLMVFVLSQTFALLYTHEHRAYTFFFIFFPALAVLSFFFVCAL